MSGCLYICIITLPEMPKHPQVSVLPYNLWDKQPQVEFWPSLTNLNYSFPQYCFPISFSPYFFFSCWLKDGPDFLKCFFCVILTYFSNYVFFTKDYYLVPHPSFLNPNPVVMPFSELYRALSLWWSLYLLLVIVACLNNKLLRVLTSLISKKV